MPARSAPSLFFNSRFVDTATLIKINEGHRNNDGDWVSGGTTPREITVVAEPIESETDNDDPTMRILIGGYRFFLPPDSPVVDILRTDQDDVGGDGSPGDVIAFKGTKYRAHRKRIWDVYSEFECVRLGQQSRVE